MIFGWKSQSGERHTLRSEDGHVLEVKEAVVLDEHGQAIYDDRSVGGDDRFSSQDPFASVWTYRSGQGKGKTSIFRALGLPFWIFLISLLLLTPVFFAAGLTLFAFVGLVFFFVWILRGLSRLLS